MHALLKTLSIKQKLEILMSNKSIKSRQIYKTVKLNLSKKMKRCIQILLWSNSLKFSKFYKMLKLKTVGPKKQRKFKRLYALIRARKRKKDNQLTLHTQTASKRIHIRIKISLVSLPTACLLIPMMMMFGIDVQFNLGK